MHDLPYLKFPANYHVKVLPAFAGAVARFWVRKDSTPGEGRVSVYFDAYCNLGACSGTYWEVYPCGDGETARFLLGEEKEMLEEVEKALVSLEKNHLEKE